MNPIESDVTRLVDESEPRRRELLLQRQSSRVELPLRLLRQQAHFTTPASDLSLATKAVEQGFAPVRRMLDRWGISRSQLAERFDLPQADVDALLDGPSGAPLVMLDGEDAQALREDVLARGRENAVRVLREADWGASLRFYRPSGLELSPVQDLATVLLASGEGRAPEAFPVDGVIWPKAEHPDELEWLCDVLARIERRLGLEPGQIRLQFLVESGWALAQLPALVRACGPRLCGVIYGISDHSADAGLSDVRNDHPLADHARLALVNAAGAAGVPAIDAMTVNYPVADASLDEAANRERLLARMRECFDDARHGQALGMAGKWVGHPAQLFACLLAYRAAMPDSRVEQEVRRVEAYQQAVEAGRGATIIDGVMVDRANDRHSRELLRRAVVLGRLEVSRARALGVITAEEHASLAI